MHRNSLQHTRTEFQRRAILCARRLGQWPFVAKRPTYRARDRQSGGKVPLATKGRERVLQGWPTALMAGLMHIRVPPARRTDCTAFQHASCSVGQSQFGKGQANPPHVVQDPRAARPRRRIGRGFLSAGCGRGPRYAKPRYGYHCKPYQFSRNDLMRGVARLDQPPSVATLMKPELAVQSCGVMAQIAVIRNASVRFSASGSGRSINTALPR